MILLVFFLSYVGFAFLSLAMQRHFIQVMPSVHRLRKKSVKVLRALGFTLLLAAAVLMVVSYGTALGLVYYTGLLTLAALLQSLLLAYRPKWLAGLVQVLTASVKK